MPPGRPASERDAVKFWDLMGLLLVVVIFGDVLSV